MAKNASAKRPNLDSLREKLAEATARRDELQLKVDEMLGVVAGSRDPRVGLARLNPEDLACARDLAAARDEVEGLEREVQVAKQAERARRREQIAAKKAPLIKKLNAALDEAAKVNSKLAEIEDQEDDRLTRLAWPELMPEQPQAQSRLERWRRMCESQGYEL